VTWEVESPVEGDSAEGTVTSWAWRWQGDRGGRRELLEAGGWRGMERGKILLIPACQVGIRMGSLLFPQHWILVRASIRAAGFPSSWTQADFWKLLRGLAGGGSGKAERKWVPQSSLISKLCDRGQEISRRSRRQWQIGQKEVPDHFSSLVMSHVLRRLQVKRVVGPGRPRSNSHFNRYPNWISPPGLRSRNLINGGSLGSLSFICWNAIPLLPLIFNVRKKCQVVGGERHREHGGWKQEKRFRYLQQRCLHLFHQKMVFLFPSLPCCSHFE